MIGLAAIGIWPKVIGGVVLAALIGWGVHSVYSAIYDRGQDRGVADTQQAERDCIEGSVCAEAADKRAATQREVIADALAAAKVQADAAAAVALEQEQDARAAAESRATAARAAASAAERRFQQVLAASQSCRTWAETEVPCPLTD